MYWIGWSGSNSSFRQQGGDYTHETCRSCGSRRRLALGRLLADRGGGRVRSGSGGVGGCGGAGGLRHLTGQRGRVEVRRDLHQVPTGLRGSEQEGDLRAR